MDAAEAVLRKAGLRPVFQGAGAWVSGQTPADAVVNRGTRVTCRVRAGRVPTGAVNRSVRLSMATPSLPL